MKLDITTQRLIAAAVEKAVAEVLTGNDEIWVRGKDLGKWFACFNQNWLKKNGTALPRKVFKIIDKNGVEHETDPVYPKNQIQRMMQDGSFVTLKVGEGRCEVIKVLE